MVTMKELAELKLGGKSIEREVRHDFVEQFKIEYLSNGDRSYFYLTLYYKDKSRRTIERFGSKVDLTIYLMNFSNTVYEHNITDKDINNKIIRKLKETEK